MAEARFRRPTKKQKYSVRGDAVLKYGSDSDDDSVLVIDGGNGGEDSNGDGGDDSPLTWRMDGEESHSDWSVRVVVVAGGTAATAAAASAKSSSAETTTTTTTTYPVHKNILGIGPRKSDYFASLFRAGGSFREATDATSKIELPGLAADAFPALLDHVYEPRDVDNDVSSAAGNDKKTKATIITPKNAVALYYMSKYFQIGSLSREVKIFWKTGAARSGVVDPVAEGDHWGTYVQHAMMLGDEPTLETVKGICAQYILSIRPTSKINDVATVEFWLAVSERVRASAVDKEQRHLSRVIADFCQRKICELDNDSFAKLTSEDIMPVIDCDAAWTLLDAENELQVPPQPKTRGKKAASASSSRGATSSTGDEITSVQRRCIDALAEGWHDVDLTDTKTAAVLAKLSPGVVAQLYKDSMVKAREKVAALKSAAERSARRPSWSSPESANDRDARRARVLASYRMARRQRDAVQAIEAQEDEAAARRQRGPVGRARAMLDDVRFPEVIRGPRRMRNPEGRALPGDNPAV